MPNSLVQGLTTTTAADLNRLPAFPMTTLLGLLTLVDPKHPDREVQARPSDILEIIEVGKQVAQAVDRSWTTIDGEARHRRYAARRYSPKKRHKVHEALLGLHNQAVVVQRYDPKTRTKLADRTVHILDMFGYSYEQDGRALDVDDLPAGKRKENISGNDKRPVWRVRRYTERGEQDERPTGILFRLNTELANEMVNHRGSIGFTLLARRVFRLLNELRNDPGAIRLLLLILRQTGRQFTRHLSTLLDDPGWCATHPTRGATHLTTVLERLQVAKVVDEYQILMEEDRVVMTKNKEWHLGKQAEEAA